MWAFYELRWRLNLLLFFTASYTDDSCNLYSYMTAYCVQYVSCVRQCVFFCGLQFDDLMAAVKSASDSSTIVVAGKPDTRQKVEGFNKMVRTRASTAHAAEMKR